MYEIFNKERLERLLKLEKERRGLAEDALLFIGMANLAQYYWCGMKSWFLNKRSEVVFFGAYLQDRIEYSIALGRIDRVPEKDEDILEVGSDLTLEDVEGIIKKRNEIKPFIVVVEDMEDNKEIERELMEKYGGKPSEFAVFEINRDYFEKDPFYRGAILQEKYAEKYPRIRWNFSWRNYVVVGAPDGITDEFVYEFKSTKSKGGFARIFLRKKKEKDPDILLG